MAEPLVLRVRISGQGLERLRRLGRAGAAAAMVRGVRRTMVAVSNAVKLGLAQGAPLKQRSGSLARSWLYTGGAFGGGGSGLKGAEASVERTRTGAVGSIGSRLVYSAVHEHGGTITPKKGRYLAIPLGPTLTASGVAKERFRAGPRSVAGLFAIRSRAGNLLLARRAGRRGALEILYVLKESVRIPARRYVTLAAAEARGLAPGIFDAAISEEIEVAGLG